ncbi:MAG: PHP-associated domain-containing protein [Clostridiaceae bacterium]|nr:PHP-associated domain-containing protein [Clostridiaceae bacterium]
MNHYRFEMHFHTAEVSSCATVSAAQSVGWYLNLGYSGIIVTDHYCRQHFEKNGEMDWRKQIDGYLAGYDLAVETARDTGLTVLMGMEIRFDENGNDYLVYGISRKLLIDNPHLYEMTLHSFNVLARENNLMVYQAHPMRDGATITNPCHLDGVEVCNGCVRHDSRNDIAAMWAKKFDLQAIAGSDFHQPGDEGRGGLDFHQPVPDNETLVMLLSNQAYTLVIL